MRRRDLSVMPLSALCDELSDAANIAEGVALIAEWRVAGLSADKALELGGLLEAMFAPLTPKGSGIPSQVPNGATVH